MLQESKVNNVYCVIDIETTGLNRFKDKITWIGMSFNRNDEKRYDPVKVYCLNPNNSKHRDKFFELCARIKNKKIPCVWQNGKFDTLFLEHKLGVKLPISEDVMLMGTAYDLVAEHGLKKMAMNYLGVDDWDIKNKDKLSGAKDVVVPYLKLDLKYTQQLFVYFKGKLDYKQVSIYKNLLMRAYRMYRDVELNGIYIDVEKLREVREKYHKAEADKLAELNSYYEINWNSSQQKQKVLFEDEELPILKKTPKGAPSADASTLKKLAAKGYELPKLILEYSASNTLNKMFLNRWEDDADEYGRLHPSFNLTNVVSGRTSCNNPNLQQVPRTKDVRGLFTAPEGRLFFEADYSQLELRIAAHYAKDRTMLKIYREGGDIHTETARVLTGGREPTKDERSKAKAVNFGFLYGMQAKKFVDYAYNSYGVVFTQAEAQRYRDAFFAKYSRLLPWHKEQEEICESLGGVYNLFGRFRKLPKIYSPNKWERAEAARRAINTPVQGTGSDILLSAAIEVHKTLTKYGLKICGTIHDSIVGEFNAEDEKWIVPEIKRIMAHPKLMGEFGVSLDVSLEADVGVGPWGSK